MGQCLIKCALLTFKVFFNHNNVVCMLAANTGARPNWILESEWSLKRGYIYISYFTIQHKCYCPKWNQCNYINNFTGNLIIMNYLNFPFFFLALCSAPIQTVEINISLLLKDQMIMLILKGWTFSFSILFFGFTAGGFTVLVQSHLSSVLFLATTTNWSEIYWSQHICDRPVSVKPYISQALTATNTLYYVQ